MYDIRLVGLTSIGQGLL